MSNLVLLLCIAILLYVAKNWYENTPEKKAKETLWRISLYFLAGLMIVLFVLGRVPALYAMVAAMLPLLQRLWLAKSLYRTWQRYQSGDQATLQSRYIRVQLDQKRGTLEGWILAGSREGQVLSSLDRAQLSALEEEIAADPESLRLLQAYLQQRFGSSRGQNKSAKAGGVMSEQEAYAILGLKPGVDMDTVKKTHKKLIQKFHPDRGGSDYLAAKINEAKDVLQHALKGK